MLFPTDDAAVEVAKGLGVAHYRHASFGQFPQEEAASYGDNTFVAMMWIKVLCVYLPVNLGYSVLFQDADVVWLRDPLKEFFNVPKLAVNYSRRRRRRRLLSAFTPFPFFPGCIPSSLFPPFLAPCLAHSFLGF